MLAEDEQEPFDVTPTLLRDMPLVDVEMGEAEVTPRGHAHRPSGTRPWVAATIGTDRLIRQLRYDLGDGEKTTDTLILAADGLTMHQLVTSAAFADLGNPLPRDAAVLVTSSTGYVGALIGEDLEEIAHAGQVRAIIDDPRTFGELVDVPLLVRTCQRCRRTGTFERRPSLPPECPATATLAAHSFEW